MEGRKYILRDKSGYLHYVNDGELSTERKDAKVFNDHKEVESKSVELQFKEVPTYFIEQID